MADLIPDRDSKWDTGKITGSTGQFTSLIHGEDMHIVNDPKGVLIPGTQTVRKVCRFDTFDDNTGPTENPRVQAEMPFWIQTEGVEVWEGFSFYRPSNYPVLIPGSAYGYTNAFMTHHSFGDKDGTGGPAISVLGSIQGTNYFSQLQSSVRCWNAPQTKLIWIDIITRVKLTTASDGFIEIFLNTGSGYVKQKFLSGAATNGHTITNDGTRLVGPTTGREFPLDTRLSVYYKRGIFLKDPYDGDPYAPVNPVVLFWGPYKARHRRSTDAFDDIFACVDPRSYTVAAPDPDPVLTDRKYDWTITQPSGVAFPKTGVLTSFTPTEPGDHKVRLVVTDAKGQVSQPAEQIAKVASQPTGAPPTIAKRGRVVLTAYPTVRYEFDAEADATQPTHPYSVLKSVLDVSTGLWGPFVVVSDQAALFFEETPTQPGRVRYAHQKRDLEDVVGPPSPAMGVDIFAVTATRPTIGAMAGPDQVTSTTEKTARVSFGIIGGTPTMLERLLDMGAPVSLATSLRHFDLADLTNGPHTAKVVGYADESAFGVQDEGNTINTLTSTAGVQDEALAVEAFGGTIAVQDEGVTVESIGTGGATRPQLAGKTVGTAASPVTSVSVPTPTGTSTGDLLVAAVYHDSTSSTAPTLATWTLLRNQTPAAGSLGRMLVYTKTASSTEPTSQVFTFPAAGLHAVQIARVAVGNYTGIAAHAGSSAVGTTITFPQITPAEKNGTLLLFGTYEDALSSGNLMNWPAGTTEQLEARAGAVGMGSAREKLIFFADGTGINLTSSAPTVQSAIKAETNVFRYISGGDTYEDGTRAEYRGTSNSFLSQYGTTVLAKTWAIPQNHDWHAGNITEFLSFFVDFHPGMHNGPHGSFSYLVGNWHFIGLDTEVWPGENYASTTKRDAVFKFLNDEITKYPNSPRVVTCSTNRYLSAGSEYSDNSNVNDVYDRVVDTGGLMYLAGDSHTYQRSKPIDRDGVVVTDGSRPAMVNLTCGCAGRSIRTAGQGDPRYVVSFGSNATPFFGYMVFIAQQNRLLSTFRDKDGATTRDSFVLESKPNGRAVGMATADAPAAGVASSAYGVTLGGLPAAKLEGPTRGINDAGGEFGAPIPTAPTSTFSNANPGTYDTHYHYSRAGTLTFLAGRGLKLIRLPFRLERLFGPDGAIVAAERDRITAYLNNASAAGVQVILDAHNYGAYWRFDGTQGVRRPVGSPEFPRSVFAAMCRTIYQTWGAHAAFHGMGLMNEPVDIPESMDRTGPELITDGGFETGTTGVVAGANTTIAQSTTRAQAGTGSLTLTAVAAGDTSITSTRFDVAAGTVYAAEVYATHEGTARTVGIQINWFAGTTFLSTSNGRFAADTAAFTGYRIQATAPGTATRAEVRVVVQACAAGEVHRIDSLSAGVGTVVTGARSWEIASQQAVAAIREVSSKLVFVGGYFFSTVKN